jgi:SM-20-related protein
MAMNNHRGNHHMQTAHVLKQEADLPIDISRLRAATLESAPYEHVVVPNFIRPEWRGVLLREYPVLKKGGSFAVPVVGCGEHFHRLVEAMNGFEFRQAVEDKFSVNLKNRPKMFTVRGQCCARDGKVHTDSESKLFTALLYMNPTWQSQGGRPRLLRSDNINDVAREISPDLGTLLIFRRSEHSFHGHLPYEGPRNVLQMSWVKNQRYVDQEQNRHLWTALFKRLKGYQDA